MPFGNMSGCSPVISLLSRSKCHLKSINSICCLCPVERLACTWARTKAVIRDPAVQVRHHRTCLAPGSGQGCRWVQVHLLGGYWCWCWYQDRRSVSAWQRWCCSWTLARNFRRTMGLEEKRMPIITKSKHWRRRQLQEKIS